jgi:hypothetical protein
MRDTQVSFTLFSPIWPNNLTRNRLNNGIAIFTEAGREKRCSKCKEYWPADTEFFYPAKRELDGLNPWCKACYRENRSRLR